MNENLPVVKFILTDDFKPLHAMKKIFGPPSGPIRKPTRVRVDIIGELLKQYNAPRLFEVIPINTKSNGVVEYSERVELTLANYRESWYTISGKEIPVVGLGDAKVSSAKDPDPAVKEESAAEESGSVVEESSPTAPIENDDTAVEALVTGEAEPLAAEINTLEENVATETEMTELVTEPLVTDSEIIDIDVSEVPGIDQDALAKILSEPQRNKKKK